MAESQPEAKTAAESLKVHLQDQGWAMNPKRRIEDPRTMVQFWGPVWHGQIRELPNKVQQIVQQFPVPTTAKQLQTSLGLLRQRIFILRLAVLMRPLQQLTKKRVVCSMILLQHLKHKLFTLTDCPNLVSKEGQ